MKWILAFHNLNTTKNKVSHINIAILCGNLFRNKDEDWFSLFQSIFSHRCKFVVSLRPLCITFEMIMISKKKASNPCIKFHAIHWIFMEGELMMSSKSSRLFVVKRWNFHNYNPGSFASSLLHRSAAELLHSFSHSDHNKKIQ